MRDALTEYRRRLADKHLTVTETDQATAISDDSLRVHVSAEGAPHLVRHPLWAQFKAEWVKAFMQRHA